MRLFLLTVLLCTSFLLLSQTEIKFNSKGHVLSPGLPKASSFDTSTTKLSFTLPPDTLTAEQKELIRKKLLLKISTTIDNLNDDSVGTNRLLTNCMTTPGAFHEIVEELEHLKSYLSGDITNTAAYSGFSFAYVPSPQELLDSVFNARNLYRIENKKGEGALEANLIFTDPFNRWLVNRYNASYSAYNIESVQMDLAYKTAWRELEQLYRQIQSYKLTLKEKINSPDFCCDPLLDKIQTFSSGIGARVNANAVVYWLQTNYFFRDWLWATNGIPFINPLFATTPDKLYPASEPYLFRDSILSKYNLVRPELQQLQQTSITLNKVVIPRNPDLNLIYYDAANDYKTDKKTLPAKNITEDEKYAIVVNNISGDKAIDISIASQAIVDQSAFQKQLLVVDSALAGIASVIGPLASVWSTSLSGIFNQRPPGPANTQIAYSPFFLTAAPQPPLAKMKPDSNAIVKHPKLARPFILFRMDGKEAHLYCDDMAGNKVKLLNIYQKCICHYDHLLDTFLIRDICFALGCADTADLRITATALFRRFDEFLKAECNKAIVELVNDLNRNAACLEYYLKFFDRSLPPAPFATTTSETPAYYSVSKIITADAPVKVNYSIVEHKGVPGKKDSLISEKTTYSYNIGKKYLFQVSAGVAFTLKEYTRKSISSGNGTITVADDNDRVRMVAGLHIYPAKLFLLDNSFLGISRGTFLNRVSLFLGVGIPKPLENFYPAVSFDLLPGLRALVGANLVKNTKYQVSNNQVISQQSGIEYTAMFTSINLDVLAFGKLIGLFK